MSTKRITLERSCYAETSGARWKCHQISMSVQARQKEWLWMQAGNDQAWSPGRDWISARWDHTHYEVFDGEKYFNERSVKLFDMFRVTEANLWWFRRFSIPSSVATTSYLWTSWQCYVYCQQILLLFQLPHHWAYYKITTSYVERFQWRNPILRRPFWCTAAL